MTPAGSRDSPKKPPKPEQRALTLLGIETPGPSDSHWRAVGGRLTLSHEDDPLAPTSYGASATRAARPGEAMVTPITGDGDALLSELGGSGHASYTSTRRVFRIIDRVSTGGGRLTVKALARDLGISVSTCYHLIGILVEEGYIEKLPHRAGYRLGPTVGVLFERSRRSGSTALVEPVLHDLARIAERTAYYAVLSGSDDVVVTHVHSPPDSPPVGVPQGFTGPSHALALGKVLIAAGGSATINRYIKQHELRAFTRRTITDPTKLEAHLKEVRTRGYATDFEEFAKNLYCVAVPVCAESGAVAGAVGLATTATSAADELKRLIRLTRQAAAQISTALRGETRTPAFDGLF